MAAFCPQALVRLDAKLKQRKASAGASGANAPAEENVDGSACPGIAGKDLSHNQAETPAANEHHEGPQHASAAAANASDTNVHLQVNIIHILWPWRCA